MTLLQGSAGQIQNLGRIVAHLLHQLGKSQDSCLNQCGVAKGKAGLNSYNSKCCGAHGTGLVLLGMRSMVCADNLNIAFLQAFDQGIHILSGTKRRIHLVVRIVSLNIIGCKNEVMGANLCGYILNALFLQHFHHNCHASCGAVAQMQLRPCLNGKKRISCCNGILCGIADSRKPQTLCILVIVHAAVPAKSHILTVVKNRKSSFYCFFHGLLAKACFHNGLAVF